MGCRKQAIQAVALASHGGKANHDGNDIVAHALGCLRVSGGDEAADGVLGGGGERTGGLPRLGVIAAGAFDYEAARGGRVGGVAAGGVFQHLGEGFGNRAPGAQDLGQRNALGGRVATKGSGVEARLAAEGGLMPSAVVRSATLTAS